MQALILSVHRINNSVLDIWAIDDGLDDAFAVFALSGTSSLESRDSIIEFIPEIVDIQFNS